MKSISIRSAVSHLTAVSLVGAIALFVQGPTFAQTAADIDPLEDFQTQDGGPGIFGSDGTDASSVFDLIHNMVLNNGTAIEDFNRQRNENITDEAASFRELQMQRIELQENSSEFDESSPLD